MDRAGDRRGTASGLRPAPPGRRGDPRDADRYARDDDARSRESAFESDGASEASEEGSVSPEDAELLAKLEAEAAADKDADAEALAAFEKMDRARRRTPLGALYRVFAAPARAFEEVYASPDSLMTFSRTSELRRACDHLRNNPNFEMFIFVCVLVNGVLIALTKPEAQMDAGASAIVPTATSTALQATFVVIFTLEAAVKIIAMGFLIGPDVYLRHYWNMLDFVVVVAGVIDLISSSAGAALSPLRLIRTLQPLRALNKFRSGRLVLETLGASLPLLMDVVLFMLWFVVAMTVMGVMFFGGTMTDRVFSPRGAAEAALVDDVVFQEGGASRTEAEFDLARAGYFPRACDVLREGWMANGTDGAARAVAESSARVAGVTVPGDEDVCRWDDRDRVVRAAVTNVSATTDPSYAGFTRSFLCCDSHLAPFDDYVRFDTFAQGVFVVLQMMTVDGWNEVTWPMCDANGFAKPFVFASVVVVIGGFVIIQLFTSVICATLGDVNQDDDRVAAETNDVDAIAAAAVVAQRDAVTNSETAAAMSKLDAEYRENELAVAFRALVRHPYFENFIMACIALNSLMMISSHYDPAEWYLDATRHAESAFTIVFIVEFSLKHLALGFGGYWGDSWNKLDGFIVVSSIVELIMIEASQSGSGVNLSFLRVFRIFRIVRTFRVLRENKEFVRILESAINGVQAMWVFLVVWALLLIIFAILGVQLFGGQGDLDDERLGFKDVGSALLTLFVVSTGENTFEVAYATVVATDEWSGLYMIAWLVISTAVLSLILGILIDSITAEGDEAQGALEEAEAEAKRRDAYGSRGDFDDAFDDFDNRANDGVDTKKAVSRKTVDPVAEKARKDAEKATASKAERRKQSRSRADVAVVRRWLVSIGETAHTRESLATERALTPGEKLAARKRMDAFDARSRRRGAVTGIGSVRKLNARTMDELEEEARARGDEDERKLAAMKRELAERLERRRRERSNREAVLDASEVSTDAVTWARVRPPRWRRDELDIVYEDEDGQPKSEVRLQREEEEFQSEQRTHRANLRVILGVLRIPNPNDAFSGGADDAKTFAALAASPGGGLNSEASRKALAVKHETDGARGWGGGVGFLGLEGGSGRLLALRVATHPLFELFILLSIGVSSGLLAAETHTFPRGGSQAYVAFKIVDVLFTVLFAGEMLLKMYAFQVYKNPASYLRSSFNVLDVVVVAASLITLAFEKVGALRSLRLLRALRPLRSVHKLPSLKLVINAVIASVPAISHVCVLGLGLGTVLSIMGMELFQGKMWFCAEVPSLEAYVSAATDAAVAPDALAGASGAAGGGLDRAACAAAGGTWRNNKFNFDNFAEAMVSVFVISTGDNWQDIMYVAMDSVGDGLAPSRDHSSWAAAYFVLVVLVAMLFWANLFVSALVDNFNRMAANGGPTLVSDEQRRWQQAMQLATISHLERWRLAPPKNASKIRRTIHHYCKQPAFDTAVTSVIFLNLLAMVAYRHDASSAEMTAQEVFDYFFTFFYVLEACLLVAAMGWKMYWSNFMYRVDFVVALVGFLDFAIPSLREAGFGDAFRVARFLRLVKLIKISRGLRTLSLTFVQSLPAVVNISVLSALVIFIYACLGVSLYGDSAGPFGSEFGNLALSEYGNFADFPRAFVVLFVSYTGNWMSYFSDMFRDQRCDALVAPASGIDAATGESSLSCERDVGAIFYAFSFVVIAIFLLANLFVAVILEQFSACADKEGVFGGSGIVDLVITTVQLRKIAKLIKGRVVRHRHATDKGHAYTSVANMGSPELERIKSRSFRGTGFGDESSRESVRDGDTGEDRFGGVNGKNSRAGVKTPTGALAFGSPGARGSASTPVTTEAIKTAIAEAANAANANKRAGVGPTAPLDAAAEAVMALVEARTPDANSHSLRVGSALGASRFGARGAPSSDAPRAPLSSFVSRSAADGYGSDGPDAGRSPASAAPSRRGDGDSEEEDSGGDEARAGRAFRVRRRGRRAASSYVPDDDIDLDDVL